MDIIQTNHYQHWYNNLKDPRAKAKIDTRIERIRFHEKLLGDAKALGNGITELRFNTGPGYRVYCHQNGNIFLLLLAGGDKSTQTHDIKLAHKLLQEWKNR